MRRAQRLWLLQCLSASKRFLASLLRRSWIRSRHSLRQDMNTCSGRMVLWLRLRYCTSPACGEHYDDGLSPANPPLERPDAAPAVRAGRSAPGR
jgi:hypothetical protein